MHDALKVCIDSIPAGAWAVGVSGGADSVALLRLAATRGDLRLHIVHLDHQTRAGQSAADALFVQQLAAQLRIPATVSTRDVIEAWIAKLPANLSERYRRCRHELFARTVAAEGLSGIILAHHRDDQAETVLHRLLRGTGPRGLAAMRADTTIRGLRILRPLLGVGRDVLRQFLAEIGQSWREDESNQSDDYSRNRLRQYLGVQKGMVDDLLLLSDLCRRYAQWTERNAPRLEAEFEPAALASLPQALAEAAARRWMMDRNVPGEEILPSVVARLLTMARDSASPPRIELPGKIMVYRRSRRIGVLDDTNSSNPLR